MKGTAAQHKEHIIRLQETVAEAQQVSALLKEIKTHLTYKRIMRIIISGLYHWAF